MVAITYWSLPVFVMWWDRTDTKFMTDTWYASVKGWFTCCCQLSLFTHMCGYFKNTHALYGQTLLDTGKALAGTHTPMVKSPSNFPHSTCVRASSYLWPVLYLFLAHPFFENWPGYQACYFTYCHSTFLSSSYSNFMLFFKVCVHCDMHTCTHTYSVWICVCRVGVVIWQK